MGEPNDVEIPLGHALLVESGQQTRALHQQALERAGLQVTIATTLAEAYAVLREPDVGFDVVVTRHKVGGEVAVPLIQEVHQRGLCSSVVLSTAHTEATAREYRLAGAFEFVTMPRAMLRVVQAVLSTLDNTHRWRGCARGPAQFPEPVAVAVDIEAATDRLAYIAKLSPAERAVAYWVLQGYRDGQVAQRLDRAERTIKRHMCELLRKAGVQNRASLWALLHRDSTPRIPYRNPAGPLPTRSTRHAGPADPASSSGGTPGDEPCSEGAPQSATADDAASPPEHASSPNASSPNASSPAASPATASSPTTAVPTAPGWGKDAPTPPSVVRW